MESKTRGLRPASFVTCNWASFLVFLMHMPRKSPEGQNEFPHIDRLVGASSPEDKAKVERLAESGLDASTVEAETGNKELREYEKTERDLAIISLAEEAVEDVMRRYGREKSVELPAENIHLIEPLKKNVAGFYDSLRRQLAVAKTPGQDIALATVLFHELTHAKSYNALKVRDEAAKGREVTYFRTGLETRPSDGRTRFRPLNEAIVQRLTLRFYDQNISGNRMFGKEILEAGRRGDDPREREEASYYVEQQILSDMVNALVEARGGNDDYLKSLAEVEDVFFRASVTGDVAELRKTVDEMWGKGSFRLLGESLGDFWNQKLRKPKGPGLFDKLVKRPIASIERHCSSFLRDKMADDDSLTGKLFRGMKKIAK